MLYNLLEGEMKTKYLFHRLLFYTGFIYFFENVDGSTTYCIIKCTTYIVRLSNLFRLLGHFREFKRAHELNNKRKIIRYSIVFHRFGI
jgi:hypothetical protein